MPRASSATGSDRCPDPKITVKISTSPAAEGVDIYCRERPDAPGQTSASSLCRSILFRLPLGHRDWDGILRNNFAEPLLSIFGRHRMNVNSGKPWSEVDVQDLRASLDFGNTYGDAATMLRRDEDEVRQKAKELGLVERRKKW
jgi:hypothetical protein